MNEYLSQNVVVNLCMDTPIPIFLNIKEAREFMNMANCLFDNEICIYAEADK